MENVNCAALFNELPVRSHLFKVEFKRSFTFSFLFIQILVHHLIPKLILKRMRNSGKESVDVAKYLIEVCRPCHNEIHRIWPHTELAKDYQTVDMILEAPEIQPYLNWKRKRERTA